MPLHAGRSVTTFAKIKKIIWMLLLPYGSNPSRSEQTESKHMASQNTAPFSPSLQKSYRGHRSAVTGGSFHSSLTQIATSSLDGNVMVWSFKPTMRALRFSGHRGPVNCVSFNPQGNLIASGSSDCCVRLWVPTVRAENTVLKAHAASVRSLDFSSDGSFLLTGGDDKAVKMWDVSTQRFHMSFAGHSNWVRCVAMAADGRLAASGGDDAALNVWDVNSKKATHTFHDHRDSVTALAFHPDGNCVATGSVDRTVNLWDLRMNQLLQHYQAHSDTVNSLSFSPSGTWLLSASSDSSAKLWDLKEGYLYCTVNAHEGPILSARFSPCGSQFVTTAQDAMVMVWNSNLPGVCAAPSVAAGRVDPTNMVVHPEASAPSRPVTSASPSRPATQGRSSSRGGGSSDQRLGPAALLSRPVAAATRPATSGGAQRPQSAASPRQGRQSTGAVLSDNSGKQADADEVIVRQLDITGQTQQIIEHRVNQLESTLTSFTEHAAERQARVSDQLELMRQQIAEQSQRHASELGQLHEIIGALVRQQETLMKKLSDKTDSK